MLKRSGGDGGGKVKVTAGVLQGLEAVRISGATNMLDRPAVALLAEEMGFAEAALWVREHRGEYARGVFNGFEAASE